MDIKKSLSSPVPPQNRQTSLRSFQAVAAALLGFSGLTWFHHHGVHYLPGACVEVGNGDTPSLYAGESLTWESCGVAGRHPVECSSLQVPMDHFDTTDSRSKTFTIPLIRLRGREGARNLLLNPGGPGGSGLGLVYGKGEYLREVVGDSFHLLSFDPRGVNSSTPTANCYPDAESRKKLSSVSAKWVLGHDNTPELYAWATNYGRACAENIGEHGKYINTPQTAADMNSILDAVGQQDMYYWGFSYGTLLGQTYATMFPERSHRVIIDGVVNQFDWYNSELDAESVEDTEAVLDGFLDECAKAGDKCSLSAIAKTKQDLWKRLLAFGDQLKYQPLSVYVNSTTYGTVDWTKLFQDAIFPVLYKPAEWPALAGNITGLLQGNATDFFLNYGSGPRWTFTDEAFHVVAVNDGVSGLEQWPAGHEALSDILVPFYNDTMFRSAYTKVYFAKQQWLVPKTHRYVPRTGIKTAHPLLILTTTYDPVCPLVSAKNSSASVSQSRL